MSLLADALKYLDLGWSVLPVRPGAKIPHIKWKPYQTKLPTKADLNSWFRKWPRANIGIATGRLSNLVVLDLDSPGAYEDVQNTICELPETIQQQTGRIGGGRQIFFSYPKKGEVKNVTGLIKDVDVRGQGGIVIIPPSQHSSGMKYKWLDINPTEMGLDDLCEIPDDLLTSIVKFNKVVKLSPDKKTIIQSSNKPGWVNTALWGTSEGGRNSLGTRLAGYYLRIHNEDIDKTLLALREWNQRNNPPLEDTELIGIVNSISQRHGTPALSSAMGINIDMCEILKYPDGDVKYQLFTDSHDLPIRMEAIDITTISNFRIKFMKYTNRIVKAIKNTEWWEYMQDMLDESHEIKMGDEETSLPIIKDQIYADLKNYDESYPLENQIYDKAIVNKGTIHLLMRSLMNSLEYTELKRATRKDIAIYLRSLKFEYSKKPVRFGNKIFKTWQINEKKFKDAHSVEVTE